MVFLMAWAFLHTWASQGRQASLWGGSDMLVQELHGRRGGGRGNPASLYPPPSPFCSCTRHTHPGKMQVEVSPGRRLIAVTEFPYRDNPWAWKPAFPVPCSLAARAAVGAGRRSLLVRGRGGALPPCQRSRVCSLASGFQLRRPSPGSWSLLIQIHESWKKERMEESFYRHEHIVSIPAELFGGREMGEWDVQLHPVWGRHSSWGKRALAPITALVSNIKITFSGSRSPRTGYRKRNALRHRAAPQTIFKVPLKMTRRFRGECQLLSQEARPPMVR